MALGTFLQDDFSRGIVRQVEGQRIPPDGVYDCVNGLLDDDLGIYRRGGSAYKSASDAAATPVGLAVAPFLSGKTPVLWTAAGTYLLDGSNNPQLGASGGAGNRYPAPLRRPAFGGNMMAFGNANSATAGGDVTLWGGSRKTSDYSTGNATVANGSADVTGAGGAAWLANVDVGMIFSSSFNDGFAQVKSINSDTSITLDRPWLGASITAGAYLISRMKDSLDSLFSTGSGVPYVTMVGSPPRVLAAADSMVYFSNRSHGTDAWEFDATNYHLLPSGSTVTGLDSTGDTAVVFATEGVWAITNMSYDLTDDYGNPQQTVRQISKSVILWADSGIAPWRGGLIVPAIDDVFLLDLTGAEVPISGPIRPLYRSYVKAGYQPGMASVHRGHYFLPIVNGTTWVDTLVCRLDGPNPGWTRWADHGGSIAYAQEVGVTTRSPKLYGLAGLKVTDLSGCFVPASANKNDADGTTHVLSIVTRDFATRPSVRTLFRYLRARFQLDDAASDNPVLTLASSAGPPETEVWVASGSWTEGTGEDSSKIAILNSDGNPGRRVQSIRFRIQSSGPSARLVVRSLEVFYRPSGRQ